ncbi:MAG: TIM barrel protein, partial [Candidatus Diapherotrites archaeon]|nr:TIM barrel protein [Candidatus Diapherotrites archaeon]
INLNSKEAKKIKDSEQRILDTAEKAHLFGGDKVVFHPGFYSGRSSEDAFQTFYQEINDLLEIVEERGFNVHLSPETTGKKSQFGSLDEIIELCRRLPDLRMTIDFAHLFAREQGNIDFHKCLEKIENNLGTEFLKDMHMHFSGIEYTDKGERRHLTADDPKNHLKYEDIAAVLRDFDVHGNLICESPNLEVDALKMKKLLEIA